MFDILFPKQIEEDVFEGKGFTFGNGPVYGGHVIAQALAASNETIVNEHHIHSLHCYFLSPVNVDIPIRYHVDRIKDGRSFSARRIKATQNDRTIFIMAVSYHKEEKGYNHQKQMPKVPPPEECMSQKDRMKVLGEKYGVQDQEWFIQSPIWKMPIDFRPVESFDPFDPQPGEPKFHAWMKVDTDIPSDQFFQNVMLAGLSDYQILITSLRPHGASFFKGVKQTASIDHAMWFHRPVDLNQWVLYATESPNTHGGLGFNTGQFFSQDGTLLASVSQEGLIRV